MTPAVEALRRAGVAHRVIELETTVAAGNYGEAAAKALVVCPKAVFKTLLSRIDSRELVVALVPVDTELDTKALATLIGAKRVELAPPRDAERSTGYVVGGISPFGQRKALRTFADASLLTHTTVFVSAGRRGLELALAPGDLVALCDARVGAIARWR
jgi:Cys-tRNA(Pro)/Cys-tRNA(Cys) deacylase